MSKVYLEDSSLTSIANAIRTKGGTTDKMTPAQMATAIGKLSPKPNLGTKTITENGTYTASSDNLDGYSSVTVDVASSGGGGAQPITLNYQSYVTSSSGAQSKSYPMPSLMPSNSGNDITIIYHNDAMGDSQATTLTENLTFASSTWTPYIKQVGGIGRAVYMKVNTDVYKKITSTYSITASTNASKTAGTMYATSSLGDFITSGQVNCNLYDKQTAIIPITDPNVIVLFYVTHYSEPSDNLLVTSALHVKAYNQIINSNNYREKGWITFVPDGTGNPTFYSKGYNFGTSGTNRYLPYLVFKPVEG